VVVAGAMLDGGGDEGLYSVTAVRNDVQPVAETRRALDAAL
jgi:hypothetical protein